MNLAQYLLRNVKLDGIRNPCIDRILQILIIGTDSGAGSSMTNYDVIVIGGGSTGTAVARDCAMRGLKTLLLERDDIASATVGTSAGMISSGFKYYDEPELMDICSEEVVNFNRIARHIVMKNPILFPIMELSELSSGGQAKTFSAEYSKRVEERGVPPLLFLTPEDSLEVEPALRPDIIASMYQEEFFIDPFRLCLLQTIDAKMHGAEVKTYCEVYEISTKNNAVDEVSFYNRVTGKSESAKGKIIINAAGPWAMKIAGFAGAKLELRLNKGAHVILDRRVTNVGLNMRAVDGRWIYMYPHENTVLLGTTALDTWEDPDSIVTSHDEIEYLLNSVEGYVPSIRKARIIRTMEGVRPMVAKWKVSENDVTRGYEIVDHENQNVSGLISFAGGKLVTCRHMAEKVTDIVCEKLGKKNLKCETHLEPLPGMASDVDILLLSTKYDISQHALERLKARRGTEIHKILELIGDNPEYRTTICTCEPVIEAEIRYAIREEFPQTLDDLRRRLRLGTGPCQGTFCTFKAAAILAEERDLTGEDFQVDMLDFLSERWKGKRQAIRREQLVQEEVAQGIYACVGNLDQSDVDYDLKPWEE
ncbi:MAG: FAD-dependent oxidoreductase [Candidatus Thorarchaeota archaeon]|jgi:glycerol-3-phosphate dehydrogenase